MFVYNRLIRDGEGFIQDEQCDFFQFKLHFGTQWSGDSISDCKAHYRDERYLIKAIVPEPMVHSLES